MIVCVTVIGLLLFVPFMAAAAAVTVAGCSQID